MNRIWLLVAVIVLAGCTTKGIIEHQIHTGVFTFSKSLNPAYDFDVKLEKTRDINWDVGNKEDRLMIIKQMLGSACTHPAIANEQFVSRGKSVFGIENGSYLIEVTCK